uniref:RIN4 pathogenic type III effector avirulence factor Avr cleavage site domain-containing protein n=1 Tax=Kalanchoe fedtschenkoi TaxID=63787 RepID=A0A7N0UEB5_KALFE
MSQHVRIPKFGSWDAETVGYTTCFDSARQERASGVRMNPNDPEKNPEAFMSLKVDLARQRAGRAGKPPPHTNSKPSAETFQTTSRNDPARPVSKSRTPRSFHSDSGSEKSLIQRNNMGSKIQREASKVSSTVHTTLRSGNSVSQENHNVVATVPKFGSWDETDARSGDGFSIIFNKLKEEKHIGPASLRPPHPDHTSYSDAQCRHRNSLLSMICCCRS